MRGPAALPRSVRAPLLVVSIVGAVTVVVLGVLYAGATAGTAVDATLRADLLAPPSPWAQIVLSVDYFGEPVGSVLLIGTLVITFWRLGQPRAAVLVVAGTGMSVAATTVLKPVVDRTINTDFHSFPSGHTASATAYAFAVAFVVIGRRELGATKGMLLVAALTVPAAAAMAWAQVALNAHYPTDAVGGFATAFAVVPPTAWVIDKIFDRVSSAGTP